MKVLVIPMCTLLGLASVHVIQEPVTPGEEYKLQKYFLELEESITPEFVKDIFDP